ncbi:MAG: hypothetical protein EAZ79_28425 [Oscillatoriales cyanobacterium]|nr:MAG: hypothetical protein EAZ79_28425 [Oscillatoriales cyanobacterium]
MSISIANSTGLTKLTLPCECLATEEGQLPPLYFLIARFWAKLFGTSVTAMRSLPAAISLLQFPCIYWLCLELFESPMVGWVAMALISVSPIHLLYAQEARPYSLLTVLTLLSSAVFLRAMRLKTNLQWGIYTAITVVSVYTHFYALLVLIAHGIYLLIIEKLRLSKTIFYYAIAFAVTLIAGSLWYLTIIYCRPLYANASLLQPEPRISLISLMTRWIGNSSRIFFDVNRHTSQPIYAFILALIIFTSVPLMMGDLILGGRRLSGYARYLIPTYLGLQLAVAYLLTGKITFSEVNTWRQKLWQLVAIGVFSAGVLSCTLSSQAEVWWNKGLDQGKFTIPIARIVNQANSPLLITDTPIGELIPLSRRLDPKVKILWGDQLKLGQLAKNYSNLFAFLPSKELKEMLEKEYKYKLRPVFLNSEVTYDTRLWELIDK